MPWADARTLRPLPLLSPGSNMCARSSGGSSRTPAQRSKTGSWHRPGSGSGRPWWSPSTARQECGQGRTNSPCRSSLPAPSGRCSGGRTREPSHRPNKASAAAAAVRGGLAAMDGRWDRSQSRFGCSAAGRWATGLRPRLPAIRRAAAPTVGPPRRPTPAHRRCSRSLRGNRQSRRAPGRIVPEATAVGARPRAAQGCRVGEL